MTQYSYVAYNLEGGIVKGRLEAPDEGEVEAQLVEQGYKPLKIKRPPNIDINKFLSSFDVVKPKEVLNFARQSSTMLASGANLVRVLEMGQGDTTSKPMNKVLANIESRVNEGESLTKAMRDHPKVFDEVFVSLVEVGEHTGKLGPALEELADIMERASAAKAKAAKAMMMPIFLIGSSIMMLGFMAFVAFPPLIDTFEDMDVDIPWMTSALIGGIDWFVDNVGQVFMVTLVLFVVYKVLGKIPTTSFWLDQGKLRLPIMGGIMMAGELGRFCRVLATLLGNGVDLPSSLRLGKSVAKNKALKAAWEAADKSLIDGHRMSAAMSHHAILPSMLVELMAIGEESNTLPKVSRELAAAYEKEFETKIEGLLAVLEPVSTFMVGGLVLFMALSVMKPVLSAANNV